MSEEQGPGRDLLTVAAALAAVSGLIHIKAAIDHTSHWWAFGAFFGVLAYAQLGWAYLAYRGRRDERFLLAAIYASVLVAAIWLMSRTTGIPFGPWAWDAERIGAADAISTLDEIALAALLLAAVRPAGAAGRALAWVRGGHLVRFGMMLGSASLLALAMGGHSH